MLRKAMMLVAALWAGTSAGSTACRADAAAPNTSGAGSDLTFAVVSDIHVQSWDPEAGRKFARALDDLNRAAPESSLLVVNGDLGNGYPDDYNTLNRIMNSHPHAPKVAYTIGNHEFYKAWHDRLRRWNEAGFPNGETEAASISRFLKQSGQAHVYYDKRIGGFPFLFLGSEHYRQSDPSYHEDAVLSQEQLAWLEGKLQAEAGGNGPVFVFLHQPLPDTVSGSGEAGSGRGVVPHERLQALLSRYPRVILFTGHTHWELGLPNTLVKDRFVMVGSSSVSQPWHGPAGPYPPEADRSEGLVVRVRGGEVSIIGRDFARGQWIPGVKYTLHYGSGPSGRAEQP